MFVMQFASGTGRIRARPAAEEVPYNVGTGRIRARPSPTADDGPSSAAYDSGTGRIKAQPSSPAESGPSNTAYDSGTGRIRARPSAASAGEGSGHISARPDRPAERAYSRPSNGAAMSMLRLALGFVGAAIGAFDDRTDRKKTVSHTSPLDRDMTSVVLGTRLSSGVHLLDGTTLVATPLTDSLCSAKLNHFGKEIFLVISTACD